jgi:L-amino acid N-acyltransferase YncA
VIPNAQPSDAGVWVPSNEIERAYLIKQLTQVGINLKNAQPVGFVIAGKLSAIAALHDQRAKNIEVSIYGVPGWARRPKAVKSLIWLLHDWAFNKLGCTRATALIAKKNAKARKMAETVGFRLEGVLRKAGEDGRDVCLYGLLKEETKWVQAVS